MAHGRPWYKRSGGDFVMGVLHFPDNDYRWAYSAIVDTLNDRDRPLADDPAFICGIARITKQKWTKVRAYLLDHGYIMLTAEGRITNPRFERERAERDEQHERSVEGGRRGGQRSAARRAGQSELPLGDENQPENLPKTAQETSKKHGKFSGDDAQVSGDGSPEVNDLAQPPPQGTRARVRGQEARDIETPESSTSDSLPASPIDPIELSNHLTRIAGVRNIEPARIIANVGIVREWIELGVSIADIERTITTNRDRASGPLHSLKYFDGSIRKAHAQKEHPNAENRHDQPSEIADPLLRRYLERGGTLDE